MLAFIDQIVIPFLESLYGAVGYLGVLFAMTIESAMIPLPSELILPFAGFLVSDPTAIEPITGQPWNYWLVVIAATIGNTLGSLIAYAIGAYGGRPFLERYGKYILIRQHEIELADKFFAEHGADVRRRRDGHAGPAVAGGARLAPRPIDGPRRQPQLGRAVGRWARQRALRGGGPRRIGDAGRRPSHRAPDCARRPDRQAPRRRRCRGGPRRGKPGEGRCPGAGGW